MTNMNDTDRTYEALCQAAEANDRQSYERELKRIVSRHIALLTKNLGGGSSAPELVRTGIHYDSASLGRWFRGVCDGEKHPLFDGHAALRGLWENSYDRVPRGINMLTDRSICRDSIIVFGGDGDATHKNGVLRVGRRALTALRKCLDEKDLFALLADIKAGTTNRELAGLDWFRKTLVSWAKTWMERPPANADETVFSFLFTWYPVLIRDVGSSFQVAVVAPVPRERPPSCYSTIFGLFSFKRVPPPDQAISAIAQSLRLTYEPLVYRLLGIDAEILSRRTPRVNLNLERIVRALQYVSPQAIEEEDRWLQWREKFPAPDVAVGEEPDHKRWDVPMWGASNEMHQLLEDVSRQLASDGRTKHGVKLIFLYSPPGCGKENIAKLCHFLSGRSQNHTYVREALARASRVFEPPQAEKLRKALGIRKLHQRSSTGERPVADWVADDGKRHPWDFNYFVVQGGYLSSRNAATELVGDLQHGGNLGLLVRASACGGTVFFDELNTLAAQDANLFLRIAEEPHEIEIPGVLSPFPLDLLMIFASNKTPLQLVREKQWNDAVLTRLAKPGVYFEIPPVGARRMDIALAVAYSIEKRQPSIASIDVDALRWLCQLPWEGNYREIGALIDQVLLENDVRDRAASAGGGVVTDNHRITFEDVLAARARVMTTGSFTSANR